MLEIKNLTKIYKNGKKAVDNLSLTVKNGDIYGFIGHNGAGKTTTIKSIVGIHEFEEGSILIDGVSIKDKPLQCKQNLAYIPDNPDLVYLVVVDHASLLRPNKGRTLKEEINSEAVAPFSAKACTKAILSLGLFTDRR